MADQLDMFAPAPAPPPPRPAPVMITAPAKPRPPAPADETLRAMEAVTLLREIDGGRVVLGGTGWSIAMARREQLVGQQLRGCLPEGDGRALTTLSRLHIMQLGSDDSGVFVPAAEFGGFLDALAGLRCAAAANASATDG